MHYLGTVGTIDASKTACTLANFPKAATAFEARVEKLVAVVMSCVASIGKCLHPGQSLFYAPIKQSVSLSNSGWPSQNESIRPDIDAHDDEMYEFV